MELSLSGEVRSQLESASQILATRGFLHLNSLATPLSWEEEWLKIVE